MKIQKRKIKKRYIIIAFFIIIIIILSISHGNRKTSYAQFVVERQDVRDQLVLAGVIDVENRVDLGFAEGGRIESILKKSGDVVKKGQVIATLSQNKLQADLIQAQANYTVTQVNSSSDVQEAETSLATILAEQNTIVENVYQEYLSGDLQVYLKNKTSLDLEAPTLTGNYTGTQEGEYVLDMNATGESFELRGLDGAGKKYLAKTKHSTKLGDSGLYIQFAEDVQYNNTQWIIPIPNTRSSGYLTRKKAYETALATRDRLVEDARNELARATGQGDDAVSRAEAERKQAAAQVQAVYSQLGDGRILAPFDGIVAKNDLELGEIVSAFTPLVTVVNSLDKELVLNVPEIYINALEVDDQVAIVLDAYPQETFSGTIQYIDIIDTLVDGVPVYQTTVSLNEDDPRIRIGMNAQASIVTNMKAGVLALPAHFIQKDEASPYVLVGSQVQHLEKRSVETGLLGSNGMIELISGLEEGETVFAPQQI